MDCWSFTHDGTTSTSASDLTRTVHLEFAPDITHAAGCGGGSVPLDQAVTVLTSANTSSKSTPVTIHGFLGTFTADLFDELHPSVRSLLGEDSSVPADSSASQAPIQISTAPSSFSKGMYSWFPLYFPLREPLPVPAGATIGVSIWRHTDAATRYLSGATSSAGAGIPQHRVWYEWCAKVHRGGEVLSVTPIHNPKGRSYFVTL